MSAERNLTDNDYELLSAYIDEMLEEEERRLLETRLEIEPGLRRELAALRRTVLLVQHLPELKAPRSFTLTADMVGAVPSLPASSPRESKRLIVFPALSVLSAAAAMVMMVMGISMLLSTSNEDATLARSAPGAMVDVFSNTVLDDAIPPAEIAAAPSSEAITGQAQATAETFAQGMMAAPTSTMQVQASPLPEAVEEAVEMEEPNFPAPAPQSPAVMMTIPEEETSTMRAASDAVSGEAAVDEFNPMQTGAMPPQSTTFPTQFPPYKPTPTHMPGTGVGGAGRVEPPLLYATGQATDAAAAQPESDVAQTFAMPSAESTTVAMGDGGADVPSDSVEQDPQDQIADDDSSQDGQQFRERAGDEAIAQDAATLMGLFLITGGGLLLIASGLLFWLYRRQAAR